MTAYRLMLFDNMKFMDKANPYFGGGKLTPQEYVDKKIQDMREEMDKENWESEGVPYGLDKIITYSITVAGGGPSAWYNAWYDIDTRNGEIIGGSWHYSWWGNPEDVELNEDEANVVAKYYDLVIEE